MPATRTITVLLPAPINWADRIANAPTGSLLAAIGKRDRLEAADPDSAVLIIKRTDHPHFPGDYFYAIRKSEKRLWTSGETVMTRERITEAWYAADCPDVM